jgi:hypothetical protein
MSGHGGFPISLKLAQRVAEGAVQSSANSESVRKLPDALEASSTQTAKLAADIGPGALRDNECGTSLLENGMKGHRLLFRTIGKCKAGPHSDDVQLRDLMARLARRMYRAYNWQNSSVPPTSEELENPTIPSGYTYLLQLVAHDLVASSFSIAALENLATGAINTRSSALHLDAVYGGGPANCPFPYKKHHPTDETRTALEIGDARDIRRAPAPGASDKKMLSECAIADPRNDSNAVVAQITVLFHLLHNTILGILLQKDKEEQAKPAKEEEKSKQKNSVRPSARELEMKRYLCARSAVTLIYRNIIRKDLLKLLLHDEVYRDYNVANFFAPDSPPRGFIDETATKDTRIPLEFSLAVFRFGHAMVRPHYRFNERSTGFVLDTVLRQNSSESPSKMPLNADWIVRWSYFFRFAGKTYEDERPNLSMRIGPLLSGALISPDLFPGPDGHKVGLAYRDLLGPEFVGLWSAQDVIAAIRKKRGDLLRKSKLLDEPDYIDDLRRYLETDADLFAPHQMNLTASDIDALVKATPLGLFVLFEAAADPDTQGTRLGVVGSVIVAEVILAAMVRDPVPGEAGAASLKDAFTKLSRDIYEDDGRRLAEVDEIASMEELIMFVARNNNLEQEDAGFV